MVNILTPEIDRENWEDVVSDWDKSESESEDEKVVEPIPKIEDKEKSQSPSEKVINKPITYDNIINERIEPIELEKCLESKKYVDKWDNFTFEKKNMKLKPVVPEKDSKLFIQSKKKKKSKKSKDPIVIKDKRFDDWQKQLANNISNGKDILLNIATSCGKTWAVRKIVSETILHGDNTCIFVAPNIEILIENYNEIKKSYRKTYLYPYSRMSSFDTDYKKSGDDPRNAQILFITAQNLINILIDSSYEKFLAKLNFMIFDEVHLPNVISSLNIACLSKIRFQTILLSATLGNPENIINFMKKHNKDPVLISYNIRPIPIQKVLLKNNIKLNMNGAIIDKNLIEGSTLNLYSSESDPTIRDIKKYMSVSKNKLDIPNDRKSQYLFGQKIYNELTQSNKEKLNHEKEKKITESCFDIDIDIKKLISLIQSLIANDMGPIIIFNPSYTECIDLSKKILSFLIELESNDKDVKKALLYKNRLEKTEKRNRDKDAGLTPEQIRNKELKAHKNPELGDKSNDKQEDHYKIFINKHINKWRFHNKSKAPRKSPEWLSQLSEFGIGVHIKPLRGYIKRFIFDEFREKKLSILISDKTLSAGVNLPARTVILLGNIDHTLYTHMSGRAGRRGMDTQGYVIPIIKKEVLLNIYNSKPILNEVEIDENIDIINLLKLCKNKDTSLDIFNSYIDKLNKVQKDKVYNYIRWFYSHNLVKLNLCDIVIYNNNIRLVLFVKMLKNGILYKLTNKKDIDELFILLCHLINPIKIEEKSENILTKLSNKYLINFIDNYNSYCPEDLKIRLNNHNYLYKFFKNSKCEGFKDLIGSSQREIFNIKKYLENSITTQTDTILKLFIKIDDIMWNKCQQFNIKV